MKGMLLRMPSEAPGCSTSFHVIVCLLCTETFAFCDAHFFVTQQQLFLNHWDFIWRGYEAPTTRNLNMWEELHLYSDGLPEGFFSHDIKHAYCKNLLDFFDLIYFGPGSVHSDVNLNWRDKSIQG